MSCVELFLFIVKEHFKESNHIRRLDQSSRTGNSRSAVWLPVPFLENFS